MSLLELLITMLITPLLAGAISLGLLQAFTSQASVSSQMNGTANATIDQQQLTMDIQGAASISPTPLAGGDNGYCGTAGIQFLTLSQSNGDFVGYLSLQLPGGYSLVRSYCVAAENTSVPDQSTTLLTGLSTDPATQLAISCAPDNTAASCVANETISTGASGKPISWISSAYVTSLTAPVDGSSDVANHAATASTVTVALGTYTPATVNQPSTTASTTTTSTTLPASGNNGGGSQAGGTTPAPAAATISPLILLGPNYPTAFGAAGTTCATPLLHLGAGSVLNVGSGAGDIAVNAACNNAVLLDQGATPRFHGARGPGHGPGLRSGPGQPYGAPQNPIVGVTNSTSGATSQINGQTVNQTVIDPLVSGSTALPTTMSAPTVTTAATQSSCSLSGSIYTLQPGLYTYGVFGLGTTSKTAPCGNFAVPRSPAYNFAPGVYQFGSATGAGAGLINVEGTTKVTFQSVTGTSTEIFFADGFEAGQNASVTFGNGLYLLDSISNPTKTICAVNSTNWKKAGPSFLNSLSACNPGPGSLSTGLTAGSQASFSVFGSASLSTSTGGALFYVMPSNGGFSIATNGTVYLQGLGAWGGSNYQGLSLWDPNASAVSQVLLGSTAKGRSMVIGGAYVPFQQLVIGQKGTLTAKYLDVQSINFLGYGTLNIG